MRAGSALSSLMLISFIIRTLRLIYHLKSALRYRTAARYSRRLAARNAVRLHWRKTRRLKPGTRSTAPYGPPSSKTLSSRSRSAARQICETDFETRSRICIRRRGISLEVCRRRRSARMHLCCPFELLQMIKYHLPGGPRLGLGGPPILASHRACRKVPLALRTRTAPETRTTS